MIQLPRVGQVGVVVKDVEAAARLLTKRLGIGPFSFVDFNNGLAFYRGHREPYKSRVGLCNYQGLAIELIQPYEGRTIQTDPLYLPPGGQGLHHLGFFVSDAEALAVAWEREGAHILQRSWPMPTSLTIYLDTPQYMGILVELIQLGGARRPE